MVMWYSRSITHTSRSIYLSARQCVKKQRRVGQEKMVGRWNVGKTAVLAVLLNCIVSAHSQTVVDITFCQKERLNCPNAQTQSYERYCCVDRQGGVQIFNCCNPYLGLYIGIGVGVPVVIILVVIVVVLYCGCSRYQNRKMQTLIQAYNARRQREEEERETAIAAPPPYDPLQSDLPPYTEQDPYKQQLSSNQVTFEGELSDNHVTREEIQSGSGTEGENGRALPTEVPVGSREREEVESNNGEEQLVSDNAPLLSEPHLN